MVLMVHAESCMPALKLTQAYLPRSSAPEHEGPASVTQDVREGDALLLLVYRQMRLLSGNHRDLDDLVQSAIEQVLRSRFEGRSKFSTFTYGVCYRVWLKHLRSFYRWFRTIDIDTAEIADSKLWTNELARAELRQQVHRTLDTIPPKQRAAILLHDIEELDVEEVALIVNTNVGTVRSRLREGRKALAQKLGRDPYFGDAGFRKDP